MKTSAAEVTISAVLLTQSTYYTTSFPLVGIDGPSEKGPALRHRYPTQCINVYIDSPSRIGPSLPPSLVPYLGFRIDYFIVSLMGRPQRPLACRKRRFMVDILRTMVPSGEEQTDSALTRNQQETYKVEPHLNRNIQSDVNYGLLLFPDLGGVWSMDTL